MATDELIPNLFRSEYGKIVAVLCKTFGLAHIEVAEDIVSETFLKAVETWGIKGIPQNPTAWLYTVARNRAKDHFKRSAIFKEKIEPQLNSHPSNFIPEVDFSEAMLNDSLLEMIFAVCHPILSRESQIVIALRVLCGFGIGEIANALLGNTPTINKKLSRAKRKLRENNIELTTPSEREILERMDNVLSVLYLLFNEGYYTTLSDEKVRKDLCFEAMRLLYVLTSNKVTALPQAHALMALFCFHSSRFEARIGDHGESIPFDEQDMDKWDMELIKKGEEYLHVSRNGKEPTKYHLEALIAFWHTRTSPNEKEKWAYILQLYNQLLQMEYSPMAALNRTYALSRVKGKKVALREALKINLQKNHLYHSLLAELYKDMDSQKQRIHLTMALQLAKSENDKELLQKKLQGLA
ncbi:MAG: RNA polymerase sigma factor [Flavobacteriaceae bacterium]